MADADKMVLVLTHENQYLRKKAAKQRNEIARLTQALEKATAEKAKLLADLKWMRGEK